MSVAGSRILASDLFFCSRQEEEAAYLQKADRLDALMNSVTDKVRGVVAAVRRQRGASHRLWLFPPPPKWLLGDGENSKARVAELEEEVQTLKKVNKDLYDFSSQLLTKAT